MALRLHSGLGNENQAFLSQRPQSPEVIRAQGSPGVCSHGPFPRGMYHQLAQSRLLGHGPGFQELI